ncbi:hypothetical protein BPTFM16_01487 [Altererythrobacter insulae]|nr:hypothetical protein BPTFM16_01487 [Altererythrobacter insulae]
MRKALIGLAPVLMIAAGCSGDAPESEGGEGLSMAEVAERAAGSTIKPEPGQYRMTMEVLDVDIPGAPPQAAEMMRGMMGGQTSEYCLSQADVDKGFEEMARQGQDENCTFANFDIDGGDIDAKMTCDVPGQGTVTMTLDGTGTPTSSEMEMTMQGNMTGMGDSTIKMKTTHERIGDCA